MGSVVSNTLGPIITFEADTVNLLSGAYLHTQKLQSTIIIHLECCLVESRQCTVGGKSFFSAAVNDSMRGLRADQNSIFAAEHLNSKLKATIKLRKAERRSRFR